MIEVPNKVHDGWTECPDCGTQVEPMMAVEHAERACGVCKSRFNGPKPRKVNGEWNTRKWRVYAQHRDTLLNEYGVELVSDLPKEPRKMLEYYKLEQ